jgi:5'-deoxy-5'-methylthioadenosine phosphorylase
VSTGDAAATRRLAIIGGTGLSSLEGLQITGREVVNTPWGEASGAVVHGILAGVPVSFLPRHGSGHTIPPHRVNYRANIAALRQIGVEEIIAVAAVGAIDAVLATSTLAIPDQIIDYTWGREHTFFDGPGETVAHVDFTRPYSERLRGLLIDAGRLGGIDLAATGTYGATQGPRLETAAEIDRMERDGCHLVGMTGMPEAALAREAEMGYAHCAVVVNPAAGRGAGEITTAGIEAALELGMQRVRALLEKTVQLL